MATRRRRAMTCWVWLGPQQCVNHGIVCSDGQPIGCRDEIIDAKMQPDRRTTELQVSS